MRVLLADDHTPTRRLVASLVRAVKGCEVCGEARDGEEAVELAALLGPDVVILDQSMPRLSGLRAASRMKAAQPHVRVVILSMHEAGDLARNAEAAGVDAWLTKSEAGGGALRAVLVSMAGRDAVPPRP